MLKKLDVENSSQYMKLHYANEVTDKNGKKILFIQETGVGVGYEKNFLLGGDNIKHNLSFSAEAILYYYQGAKSIKTNNRITGFGEYGSYKTVAPIMSVATEYIASMPLFNKNFRFLLGAGASERFNGMNKRFNTKFSGILGFKINTDDVSDVTLTFERSLLNKYKYWDERGTLSRTESTVSLSRNTKNWGATLSYTHGKKSKVRNNFYEPEYKEIYLKINYFF